MVQRKWLIFIIVLIGPFMATLDSSIVNVALPTIAYELSVGMNIVQWIVSAYIIVIVATILFFGRLSDIQGKKIVYVGGFLIFSIGSLLCGISTNVYFLIFSRIVQGIGASMIMACNQGLIIDIFEKEERGKALGISGTVVAVGTLVGPPLGGIIVGYLNWQFIFFANIPIGIIAFILAQTLFPKQQKAKGQSMDIRGAVVFGLFITTLFLFMLNGENLGWKNITVSISFIIAFISLYMFIKIEKSDDQPMLDLKLFRNNIFTISIICSFISYTSIFFTNIIHPFFLQHIMNMKVEYAGIIMMVFPISVAILATMSGFLIQSVGAKKLTLIGLTLTSIGLLLMSNFKSNSSLITVICASIVLGIGNGLFQSPNNTIVMSNVSKDKLGITGSVNALTRNLGMEFGIALSMVIFYNRLSAKIGYHVNSITFERNEVFIYAMRSVYIVGAMLAFLGVLITLFRLKSKASN